MKRIRKKKTYFCLAIMSGLSCDRVVRLTDEGVSLGFGLVGGCLLILLDLLKVPGVLEFVVL